ncbi:hypothetical protein [Streptosporangium roseum]|uniref:hypothetical protein n=1 Tax=Streptosporangium roseum TaxID=2001 RepID=UPI0033322670
MPLRLLFLQIGAHRTGLGVGLGSGGLELGDLFGGRGQMLAGLDQPIGQLLHALTLGPQLRLGLQSPGLLLGQRRGLGLGARGLLGERAAQGALRRDRRAQLPGRGHHHDHLARRRFLRLHHPGRHRCDRPGIHPPKGEPTDHLCSHG